MKTNFVSEWRVELIVEYSYSNHTPT